MMAMRRITNARKLHDSEIIIVQLSYQSFKSRHKVITQVLPMLNTNANSQQSSINPCIRHGPPFNQTLNASKTGSVVEVLQFAWQSSGQTFVLHDNRKNWTVTIGHLFFDPRLCLKTGVSDLTQNFRYSFCIAPCRYI